ncbi:BMC domain-containing protein [Luteococcus sp. H101]|uniref:BMC domain-containing protein n=1 Tax=unclassified Luteococcus TaxID=2639923 RepID=UPI00313F806B
MPTADPGPRLTKALGLIETFSLTAAVEAADAACKSADVELVGYELAKGGGLVTVKVLGQVAAVQSAVAAAKAAAGQVNRVVSTSVIPRPNEQLERMVFNNQTVGFTPTTAPASKARATTKKEEEK